jgi:pyrroloquinoline quinone (PQQ) biosynthesis protein C
MRDDTYKSLKSLAQQHHIEGLSFPSLAALNEHQTGYSIDKARQFLKFQQRIDKELLQHRVITHNPYTLWFKQGDQNLNQIKAFIVQFSVFSNQFLIAQLNKMIHADTLEAMRASKEILANELGVSFKSATPKADEPDLGSIEGSIEGSTFHFSAGHFEWLYSIAKKLGLDFSDIGQPKHGTEATLFFCNELIRLYGGDNYQISQAASYAVENWAAAGFWKQLITGFRRFNERSGLKLPLGFFVWHDKLEAQHASHTQEELEELYFTQQLDEDLFIHYGCEMLDGVAAFWDGLDEQRRELAAIH